jgi:hypothetical protein
MVLSYYTIKAQDITFIPQDTILQDTLGADIAFYIDVTNISGVEQTVFIVRTINNLPVDWTSSMCFDVCFSPEVDTIFTTSEWGSSPLQPGETREMSLHVFPQNNDGMGEVQLKAGTLHNPTITITIDFNASVLPVSVNDEGQSPSTYSLEQNFPNPFNPSTKINYTLNQAGFVQLKVYNILGVEVATLVNGYKYSGDHSVDFNASKLSSGVYLYQLSVNNFTQTRKMILEK